MRRALVFSLYGTQNAGDMAICLGLIPALEAAGYRITFVSRFDATQEAFRRSAAYLGRYHPNVRVEPGLFHLDRSAGRAAQLRAHAAGLVRAILPRPGARLRALLEGCDAVFFNGGNLLRGETLTDYARMVALFYPIRMARRAGKPTYCMPQSTAALSRLGRWLLGRSLAGFQQVFVRESLSYARLSSLYPGLPLRQSTDLAFFMRSMPAAQALAEARYPALFSQGPEQVAIVLRATGIGDLGSLPKARRDALEGALEAFVRAGRDRRYWVFVQTEKDEAASRAFCARLAGAADVGCVAERDPYVLRALYARMRATVSMRLHACILSLGAGTPAIGLLDAAWGPKNAGVLTDYGMPWSDGTSPLEGLYRALPPRSGADRRAAPMEAALVRAIGGASPQDFSSDDGI